MMELEKKEFTIQEVAAATGLSAHTLRYYERIGLIRPITRLPNGYLAFAPGDIAWLQFLIRLRDTGMPVSQMKEYAMLRYEGNGTVPERKRILEDHRRFLLSHITELQENLKHLDAKIEHYDRMEMETNGNEGPLPARS